jgi:hypothetical protein
MSDTQDLNVIMNDHDWLDMKIGDQGLMRGKSDARVLGSHTLLITFPWDWTSMVIEITDDTGLTQVFPTGTSVEVKVTRTKMVLVVCQRTSR